MKAVIYSKYGSPEVIRRIEEVKPEPGDHEVLIRNFATTVSSGDDRIRGFKVPGLYWLPFRLMMGIKAPRKSIQGSAVAGVIEETGKNVTAFKKGDRVYGSTGMEFGCNAEYVCVSVTEERSIDFFYKKEAALTKMPEGMTYEEAAAIPFGGLTALGFLRKANIAPGQKVLIYGASGAVGTSSIQIAKYFGAEVTAVCSSSNFNLVKSLGASKVIDYTKEDIADSGEIYDIVFDAVGKSPFTSSLKALKKNGFYLRTVHMDIVSIVRGIWTNLTSNKKVLAGVGSEKIEDLDLLRELFDANNLKAVIDKVYTLDQMIEAHAYVDKGHKKGNVVIKITR